MKNYKIDNLAVDDYSHELRFADFHEIFSYYGYVPYFRTDDPRRSAIIEVLLSNENFPFHAIYAAIVLRAKLQDELCGSLKFDKHFFDFDGFLDVARHVGNLNEIEIN